MADTVELVQIDTAAINAAIDKTTQNIIKLEAVQKSLREDSKKTDKQLNEEGKTRKDLSKQMALNNEELKDLKAERRDGIKLLKSEAGSLDQLKARQAQLIKQRKKLGDATGENKDKIAELNAELRANQDVINESSEGFANFTGNMEELTASNSAMAEALENSGGAVGGLIGQFKAFFANPYAVLFAAIAAAITGIGAAFKSSRAGGVLLAKGMTDISATVEVVKNRTGEALVSAVENGQAMRDESVAAGGLDTSLSGLLKNLKRMVGVTDDGTKSFSDQVAEVSALKKELIDLNSAYVDVENELLLQITTLRGLGEVQGTIADDATRSLAEQRKAAQEAAKFDEQAGQTAVELANKRLEIAAAELEIGIAAGALLREQDGTITSLKDSGIELEKSFTEAQVAAIEASNNLTTTRLTNQQRIAQINQDDFEQELDFLLDIADAQKTVNETQIADQRLALDERKAILNETNALIESSYDDQISLFERELGVQLDRNAIADLNNQQIVEYAKGLNISEIATNRLREVIIERRKAEEDLAQAQRDINEEETQRRAKALEDIKAFDNAKYEQLLTDTEAVRDFRLAEAEREYEKKIEQDGLLKEELIALEVEYLSELDKINAEFRKAQIEEERKAEQEKSKIRQQSLNVSRNLFSNYTNYQLDLNQSSLDAQLAANEGNEKKQEQLKKDAAKKDKQIKRRQALIGAALAVIQAFAQLGPIAGAIAAIGVGITTAFQIRAIDNAKFANGGEVKAWNVSGPSHAQGGIPLSIGGQYAGEIEGNEGVYVVNKRDNPAAIAALSSINSMSGKPFTPSGYMQDGGEATTQSGGLTYEQALELAEARPIIVRVADINDGQSTQAQVVANGEI